MKFHLTEEELKTAVVYAAEQRVPANTRLQFPGVGIEAQHESYLFFIDQAPMANWGHPCRYLLINCESAEARSFAARFPPFPQERSFLWRVIYKAPLD